jgi:hypothetical protein
MKQQEERLLKWFDSEKEKDNRELEIQKNKIAQQIRQLKKEDLFKKPKKLTLWEKIKLIILGN